jgi:hypothetical protein
MKDGEISLKLNYSRDWLSVMKHRQKEKYDFVCSFNSNKYKSILLAEEYIETLLLEVQDIFFSFESVTQRNNAFYESGLVGSNTTSANCSSFVNTLFRGVRPLSRNLCLIRKLENFKIYTATAKG